MKIFASFWSIVHILRGSFKVIGTVLTSLFFLTVLTLTFLLQVSKWVISANIQEMSQQDEKESCLRTCMEIFYIPGGYSDHRSVQKKKKCSQLKYVGRAQPILHLCTSLLISLRMKYSPESVSKHISPKKIK